MEKPGTSSGRTPGTRHFREQGGDEDDPPADWHEHESFGDELPFEVNMTNEPGGDPYNHTGGFKRLFR